MYTWNLFQIVARGIRGIAVSADNVLDPADVQLCLIPIGSREWLSRLYRWKRTVRPTLQTFWSVSVMDSDIQCRVETRARFHVTFDDFGCCVPFVLLWGASSGFGLPLPPGGVHWTLIPGSKRRRAMALETTTQTVEHLLHER